MNRIPKLGNLLAIVLSMLTCARLLATESQLGISISGAIQISENVYVVGIPEGGNTTTVTITGSGTVEPPESGYCKQYCPDGETVKASTDASAKGDARYTFAAGAGEQTPSTGPTIVWTIKSDTGIGSYDFQLTKIEQDYMCPEDYGGGEWTEDNSQASAVKTVWVVKAEVTTVKFGSDHQIMKDNKTTWEDGGTVYTEPEWTSGGTNHPISHTKDGNISLEVSINYTPAGAPAVECTVVGAGLKDYESKTVNLAAGGNTVAFTSKNKIDNKVFKLQDSIAWTLGYAGTTANKTSGQHTVYVTYGTPAGSDVTEQRVAWVVEAAADQTDKDDCAEAIFLDLDAEFDLTAPMWGPDNIWMLHVGEPHASQCPGLAKYVDFHFQMLGLGAGVFRYCHATALGQYVAKANPPPLQTRTIITTEGHNHATTHDDHDPAESLVHWDSAGGPNAYEATCLFNNKHYACGIDIFGTPKAVVVGSFEDISWQYIVPQGQPAKPVWTACGEVPWVEVP